MNAIAKITTANLIQVRKNLNFVSDATPKYWFENDPFKTRIADSLQLVFPDGERYFIESVRAYRDDIKDDNLKQAVKDFIMQEAQHGMAHDKVNQTLKKQGIPVDEMVDLAKTLMRRMTKKYSREFNIANTAATEHLTALMAKCFFEKKATMANVDPYMRALMAWHAIEEMEHRAVCFDVMRDVANVNDRTRIMAMLQTSTMFPLFTLFRANTMLKADGFSKLQRFNMFRKGIPWLFGPNGMLAPIFQDYMEWYDPDFHPDNQPMIHSYGAWLETYDRTGDPIQAAQALWEAGHE